MNKSVSRSCLITALVSFVAGILLVSWAFYVVRWAESNREATRRERQRINANAFFYRTMHALFEGTYNSEEGSVSQQALNTFKKYESTLGGKCWADIGDEESGYYWGMALFPSGDIFEVFILGDGKRFMLTSFDHEDWERLWRDALRRSGIKDKEDRRSK